MDPVHRGGPWTGSMKWSMDWVHMGGPWAWVHALYTSTQQRHDRDQAENQQNAATVDSCFEQTNLRLGTIRLADKELICLLECKFRFESVS